MLEPGSAAVQIYSDRKDRLKQAVKDHQYERDELRQLLDKARRPSEQYAAECIRRLLKILELSETIQKTKKQLHIDD